MFLVSMLVPLERGFSSIRGSHFGEQSRRQKRRSREANLFAPAPVALDPVV